TAAFATCKARFHDNSSALEALKADGREIHFEEGRAYVNYDSEILELSDALLRFGYDRRELVDGRSLPREGAGASRPGIASKADYTTAQKVQFISENGLAAWEKLPSSGIGSAEIASKADWYRL